MGKIVIFNQGNSQQLPGFRFDEEFNRSDCPVSISNYRNNLVEFGMNNGSSGSSGISLYERAQDLANDFLIDYDSNFHDWVSINYEGFTTVQLIQRGISSGLDPDQPIPDWYYYLPRDAQGVPLSGPSEQIAKTVADFLNKPYNPTDPITWREAYDALIDVHDYTVEQIKRFIPNIKIDNWWKHSPNIIPLGGNGWYQHPPQTSQQSDTILFGVDSLSKSAVAAANLINGAQCYVVTDNGDPFSSLGNDYPTNSKNESEWGTIDSAEYPLGSFAARAHAIAFEQAVNAIPLSNQVDLITPQMYNNLTVRSLEDHVHYPDASQIPGSPDLVCVSRGKYAERSEYKEALKLQIRQTWLSSVKHHGDAATIGTELAMDSFLPGNPGIGHAMSHDDYIELRVQPCLDPVTQEEVDLYDLPQYWAGNVLIPDYWTMWNATYFFISEVPFTNQQDEFGNPVAWGNYTLEDIENSRDNLIHRFGGENAPTVDWQQGSDWHQHVCYGLEQFSLERCEHIKETLERARIENISKKSTWETILGYLNNISQYCNLEDVNGCTSQNPNSEIHSYPDSLHTVIGEGSTDQTPLDAIQCVDTLELKVPSSPYTSTSFYDNFLENITTQAYTQDCPFTYTKIYNSNGNVFYDTIPQVEGDSSSDDMAQTAGVERYLIIYQQNVGHDNNAGNIINVQVVANQIDQAIAGAQEGITHVCLDFENPFYADLNKLRLDPNDPDGLQARQSLIDLVTECKSRHPNLKWGYYGFPNQRSNFIANKTVGDLATIFANDPVTVNGVTKTGLEWIQDRIEERYATDGPIIEACDYMSPTGYDRYPPIAYPGSTTRGNPSNTDLSNEELLEVTYDLASNPQTQKWTSEENQYHLRYSLIMGMCKYYREQLNRPTMPVYPFVTMHYEKTATPPNPDRRWVPRLIPKQEFLNNQVKPYMDGEADGLMYWTAYSFRIDQSFDPVNYPLEETDQYTKFRDQYRESYVLDYPQVFNLTDPDNLAWKSVDWEDTTIKDDLYREVRDKQIEYFTDSSNLVRTYGAASLNKNFLLGYATQYGFDNRQGHCGEGFINTFPCFDDYVGNITATVVDLTYHNTPTGYLSTIAPKGLQIEQYAKIIAENPRLRVYQGVYVWNHRFSYWFGGTCGFIDGTCLDNTDQTCSPCFIKMHPYDEINSSYLCNGNLLSPPACSPQLECPPFTEGVVNWKFLLNTNCYNAKEFVREEDGIVKALFITYSNIQNSDYDILYNQISAKPSNNQNNDWFPLCEPCPGTCTITVKFKTYVIPDKLIAFFDNDGDGLYAEQTDSTDELILDTGFIPTGNNFYEYTFVFSDNPEQGYEYDMKDICKLQFCVIGNDDPNTLWNIEISGCHFDPTFVANGSSGGFCTMLYTTPDNEYERPIISSDGVPSGFVVSPSDDEYDSDNPNPYNQQIITCYKCNSGNCDSVSVQVDTGQTCEDYGLYTDSSTCNEECAADGDGSDSSPPP